MNDYIIYIAAGLLVALIVVAVLFQRERNNGFSLEYNNRQLEKEREKLQQEKETLKETIKEQQEEVKRLTKLYKLFNSLYQETDPSHSARELGVAGFEKDFSVLEERVHFLQMTYSNLKVIPYMAEIMSDYATYELFILAKKLDWGYSQERAKKVASLLDLRRETKAALEKSYESRYQLAYLLELYPGLQDVLDTEFSELPAVEVSELEKHDRTRDWITAEEYHSLSVTERNQLALDRYVQSKRKTKWQIGRDYELYVAYKYSLKGYDVDTFGSYMGLEDLGRDLICTKYTETLIVQCKYWGEQKTIHEKHITQLYGTVVAYCIEHHLPRERVKGILVTNIHLSETARQFADYLQILYKEGYPFGEYPRIKCNIGRDELGYQTKIYHLPFDQQYDNTKISEPGECYAFTVTEAEAKGFRRAFKWFG